MSFTLLNRLRQQSPVADATFLAAAAFLSVITMAVLRGALLLANLDLATEVPTATLAWSFLLGARFDLMVISLSLVPLVLAMLLPMGLGQRRLAVAWLAVTGAIMQFAGVAEIDFYREFHTRLNSIALHYLQEDVSTVTSMVWHGFPVLQWLLVFVAVLALYLWLLIRLAMVTLPLPIQLAAAGSQAPSTTFARAGTRIAVGTLALLLVAIGGRGTLRSGPPLRWGDAFHSGNLFANHLALNGTWTLAKAAMDTQQDKSSHWLDRMDAKAGQAEVQLLLDSPGDQWQTGDSTVIARRHTPAQRLTTAPTNIVVVMMESFSGAFTGALGNNQGITPEFDALAKEGVLFDRFFSNGTHTHQGMFATLACFPNLPGHEYLMQQPVGQHQFSGLANLLSPLGFGNAYVYNGHFAWDNQQGFFRNQGMTHFVGRDDYQDPVFSDPTWGVSDQDMFTRALTELDTLAPKGAFFAVLQTLSNHTPYTLPDPLPVARVEGFGRLDDHLTAQRYADWALGEFFRQARKTPWFNNTLFVVLGDHGFSVDEQLSEIDLLRYRVPLLLLAPGLQDSYGTQVHTVMSQVDVVPTVIGLLGQPYLHQCWGRDVLDLPADDSGFAMIKPSGSDQTVALLRGDQILIMAPDGRTTLGRYQVNKGTSYLALDLPQQRSAMTGQLTAYVQTALNALRADQTGLPSAAVAPILVQAVAAP